MHLLCVIGIAISAICFLSDHRLCANGEFFCWPASERKVLRFVNNDDNETNVMQHLPTIRFVQGYWPSQWALQYTGFLYLKEKMGVNVEFFPTLSSSMSVGDVIPKYGYPVFYWQYLEDNDYDLLLEMWPVSEDVDSPFYDSGTVVFGGVNDIYGEVGFFIPDYVYDEYSLSLVPSELKYNQILRQQYIDGYTIHSDRDWVQFVNDTLYADLSVLNNYVSKGYELPSYEKPLMFGSSLTYTMSEYGANLCRYFVIEGSNTSGIDWAFIPLGSESLLTEFAIDLYENNQPFIANLYAPHLDFATLSLRTNEHMRFERLSVRRNTDNSRDAQCYLDYQCKEPIAPLYKLGNAKLHETFPEVVSFLFNFHMLAENLNDILSYYEQMQAVSGITEDDRWLNATCQWLIENEDKIHEQWFQDVVRYDCSGAALNNCGFDYYYTDASSAQKAADADKLFVNSNESVNIGGYCANSSAEALCICSHPYLSGVDCRTHCPGMIGPTLITITTDAGDDDIANASVLANANDMEFSFDVCSGHGVCDMLHFSCECEPGFGGSGCAIEYAPFNFYDESIVLYIVWILVLTLLISIHLLSIVWLWKYQHLYKSVQALAARMTTLFTLGIILLCIGTIFYLVQWARLQNMVCHIRVYCYGIGGVLCVMCPLLKMYKVSVIYNQAMHLNYNDSTNQNYKKRIKIPDTKLVIYLLNACAIEVIVCVLYSLLFELYYSGAHKIYAPLYYRIEYECIDDANVVIYYLLTGNYLYIFFLLLLLTYFAFKNRKTTKIFNETKCTYFSSFFNLFLFVFTLIVYAVTDDTFVIINVQCCAICIGVCVVWSLFYGQRIYRFYRYPNKRRLVVMSVSAETKKKKNNFYSSQSPQQLKQATKQHHQSANHKRRQQRQRREDEEEDDIVEDTMQPMSAKHAPRVSLTPTTTKYGLDLQMLESIVEQDKKEKEKQREAVENVNMDANMKVNTINETEMHAIRDVNMDADADADAGVGTHGDGNQQHNTNMQINVNMSASANGAKKLMVNNASPVVEGEDSYFVHNNNSREQQREWTETHSPEFDNIAQIVFSSDSDTNTSP